jgi:hypothetical protein
VTSDQFINDAESWLLELCQSRSGLGMKLCQAAISLHREAGLVRCGVIISFVVCTMVVAGQEHLISKMTYRLCNTCGMERRLCIDVAV